MAIYRVPVNLQWQAGGGSPGVNVWHIRSLTSVDTDSLVNIIRNFYVALDNVLQNDMVIDLGDVTDVETQEVIQPAFAQIVTDYSSFHAPTVLQLCVTWKTSIAARRATGRTFVGPLSADNVGTDGKPTAAAMTALNSAAQGLVDASTGFLQDGAIGVYGQNLPLPVEGKVIRDILGYSTKQKFAVLRSRRD